MKILIVLLVFLITRWAVESWRHRRALAAVPIRIHVNGTRGKSSVTRLIAAALREAGIRTLAKTTGSQARIILPSGLEEPVVRIGTPNVLEQVGILDRARRNGAQALVLECMAIRPDLQRFSEKRIVRSTIGVITNTRADHLDVMGPALPDVAHALSSTIPRRGSIVLGEARHFPIFQRVADARGAKIIVAQPHLLPGDVMDGFRYIEHPDNVATVLAVTRLLDIPDDVALRGMYRVTPDVGACMRWEVRHAGCPIEFVSAFAANDLESTIAIWDRLGFGRAGSAPTVALLNLRGDRIDRSLQFADAVEQGIRADHYVLVGDYPDTVVRRFRRRVPPARLVMLGKATPATIFDEIAARCRIGARVGGIGNIGGVGHDILRYVVQGGGA